MEPAHRRGRPRSEQARRAILQAANELLHEGGVEAVTMDSIATRSKVGKPTIYRSWPNSHAVAVAAFLERKEPVLAIPVTHSALHDLRAQLRKLAALFSAQSGKEFFALLSAVQGRTELATALQTHFLTPQRENSRRMLERAIYQQEVRADVDINAALDLIYGAVCFRLIVSQEPLKAQFVDKLFHEVVRGLRT